MLVGALLLTGALGVKMDVNDTQSIIEAGVPLSIGLMDYYNGNSSGRSPGMFSDPYYWWEAGVAWGAMIDYSYYTGNTTYDDLAHMSMVFQSGDYWNYMTYNQSSTEGNDDQAFWGIAAMGAAEKNFTAPGKGYPAHWLYFAQATFNTMAARWETAYCGGGLRWQIYTWNSGYNYKNVVSNGCLFHLAARLYKFTNNETMYEWAEKAFDWMLSVKFVAPMNNETTDPAKMYIRARDGAATDQNCTIISPYEWTYDQGLLISGCAYLYNVTGNKLWYDRMLGLWSRAAVFFNDTVVYEAACQPGNTCTNDQRCFKGFFLRSLGLAQKVVPESKDWWHDDILGSGAGMAQSCSGGYDGHTCGLNWFYNGWDGMYGLGEQISAIDMINTLLVDTKDGPYNASQLYGDDALAKVNGTTIPGVYGYGDAGLNSSQVIAQTLHLNNGDKGGAGFLTAVVLLAMTGTSVWLAF